MLILIFLIPAAAGLLLFFRNKFLNNAALVFYSIVYLAVSVFELFHPSALTAYLKADTVSSFFMLILGFLFAGVALYNISFSSHDNVSGPSHTYYTIFFMLFVAAMTGVIFSTNLALLWVFIEATTLTSAYLIYYEKIKTSLEAAWKYIFICSIGIALAFVGIILLTLGMGPGALNAGGSLFFADLYNNSGLMNSFWLKISFVFIIFGFGTKMGLAPMHAWLPDAHSEAPSPVSAMLSGMLLNTACLGILRVYKLMELTGNAHFARILMLAMGFLSIFVCAVYISRTNNYKRMLAYSSIENMGIVMIGAALGGIGLFAALLHILAHAFIKASFFLTSGNVLTLYGSRLIGDVHGLYRRDKKTAWLWLLSFTGITGMPPFPLFISEFLIVKAFFDKGLIFPMAVFALLICIILYGISSKVLGMCFGQEAPAAAPASEVKLGFMRYLPQAVFLSAMLIIGLVFPEPLVKIIREAASLL